MQPEQQQRILGYFIEEARDHLNTIEQGLLNLQDTLNDPEMINEVFRAAHSIKGGAAMLGLSSIQRTAHRLEDCFKLLKEYTVAVDQKLESLFLGVSDTLKALLDQLSSPFGLSEDTANNLMSETEPLFVQLNQHLEQLVQSEHGGQVGTPTTVQKAEPPAPPPVAQPRNDWSEFQTQVLQSLREMLQLFKQSNTDSRESLQECCQQLVKLGEKFNLPNWVKLCKSAHNAIANPENTYLTLAKIIITEIKQAQELVIQDREAEITVSPELEGLELIPELELLELNLDGGDELPQTFNEFSHTRENNITFTTSSELDLVADPSEIEFDELPEILLIDTNAHEVDINAVYRDKHEEIDLLGNIIDLNGPEVGSDELGALEDLFQGETPDFETWQQEPTLEINSNPIGINDYQVEDVDHELFEFLSLDNDTTNTEQRTNTDNNNLIEDLSLLFGDTSLEADNSENLELLSPTTNQGEDLTLLFGDTSLEADNSDNLELLSPTTNQGEDLTLLFGDEFIEIEDAETLDSLELLELGTLPGTNVNRVLENNDLAASYNLPELLAEESPQITYETDSNDEIWAGILELTSPVEETTHPETTDTSNNIDLLREDTLADTFAELTLEQPHLSQEQTESSSLDIFSELEEDNNETNDDLEIGDLFALPVNAETETPTPADDIDSFWNDLETTPVQELAPKLAADGARELEESLFAASGITSDHSQQQNNNLNFYFADFDFTNNNSAEIAEIGDTWVTAESEDNLFADLENSLSTTYPIEEENLPEITEFINQPTPSNADLEFDLFADFDHSNNENLTGTGEKITEIQPVEQLQELPEITREQTLDIVDQIETENLENLGAEIGEFNTDLDSLVLELDAATDEIITDITDIDVLDQLQESLAQETSLQENTQQPELANTSENVIDDFAALDALLDEKPPTPKKAESIPADDFAALEALLTPDISPAQTKPQTPAKISEPAVTKAENTVKSSSINDEFLDLEILLAEADQTMNSPSRSVKSGSSKIPRTTTRRGREESMKIPVKQLDEMSNLVGELVVNRNTLEQDHERLRQSLDNLLIQVQHLSDVGARMQELYERSLLEASLLSSRRSREHGRSSNNNDRGFSELEMDQFTLFHTLSQETIEYIVRLRESASDIDFVTEETERVARQFRQVTTQLQEGLTKARMVPFAQAVDRLRRGVRDNAIKYGKQVELEAEGADTLIDKMILDHLTDPLTHMLNNAIAHGIETPEVRTRAGKPATGTISIRAFHQGNQTVIAVTDDGAGIDPEKVRRKGIEKGVITPGEANNMSRQEIYELLFLPSFSTADEVDDIKGRGVGMNVVINDINEIRGTVSTDSTVGKGTTFTIRLPLTLSICKALCCISDKSRIAFPMDGVEDTLDIPVTDIQKDAEGQSFIAWRDKILPFKPLHEILAFNRQIARSNVYGNTRDDDMISVVVVRSGNTMVALQIEQVLSEQEIVIKQFEGPAPKPSGVAGATVLGDGRIMPIADVLEIIDIFQGKMSKQIGGASWQRKAAPPTQEIPAVKVEPTVLIVDDSITVRELLSLSFNKAGYRVEQARDGQEAWDKLRSGLPCDIVFCDIEMPRCDGLELLSRIHKDNTLNHLPIAMLTSRGADKHRQMAFQLGASGYFTKPYLEEALLEAASRMLKGEKLVNA